MAALESFPGWEILSRRHDLMIELFRIDQLREYAVRHARQTELGQLDQARQRVCEGLSQLPA
jgi:hypothetical protein